MSQKSKSKCTLRAAMSVPMFHCDAHTTLAHVAAFLHSQGAMSCDIPLVYGANVDMFIKFDDAESMPLRDGDRIVFILGDFEVFDAPTFTRYFR